MSMTVMLATVARNEEDYIAEWLAFHLLQGVSSFLIFDNGSDDATPALALRYSGKYNVRVVPWPTQDGANFIPVQEAAYAKALDIPRSMHFGWLMFTDIDEFTFGENGSTLPEKLTSISEDIGAVMIKPYEFGSNYRHDKPSHGLVIENFRRSVSDKFACSPGFIKTIGRPHAVAGMQDTPHSVRLVGEFRDGYPDGSAVKHNDQRHGIVENPKIGGIIQHHYITKSWGEFLAKRARYSGKSRKIDDSFYLNRQAVYNVAERPTLVSLGDRIRAIMATVGL